MDATIETRLRLLHEEYIAAVNSALDEGREDLVDELANEFPDMALRVVLGEVSDLGDAARAA
ncbi:hypothetical protein [Pseudonocardia nigra]|uniref:hypothetical protein n=1 Tax=Pseudonocardia nigra TaxID=1921578 RepID=UPI001C5E78C6|nr:hypothetical protein [Pseudonocardia nigra]